MKNLSNLQEISISPEISSSSSSSPDQSSENVKKEIEFIYAINNLSSESEQNIDDQDGFRTPISSDHKIPATKRCPPAPRKPKLNPRFSRRSSSKASSVVRRTSFRLYVSDSVVESIFSSSSFGSDLNKKKIKKARKDE